jgi:hypothetical protein
MENKAPLPFYIDGTMRSAFRTCPRKFYNSYILRRVPAHSSIHLHAGKAFAKSVEETRLAYYLRGDTWERAIEVGEVAMYRAWYHNCTEEVDPQASGKTLPNMLHLHREYFKEYDMAGSDVTPFIRECGKPAVEFSFAIPIPGTRHPVTGEPFLYVGRLDMLAHRGQNKDMVWPTDEKTTGALGPKWGSQWALRGQFIGYTWAAQQYGYHVPGAIVRGCKITSTGNIGFAEIPIIIPPHVVDRWLIELQRDCADIVTAWESGDWSYDFAEGCSAYGGCPYQIVCGARNPAAWLDANFVDNLWNPVTGAGTLDDKLRTIKEPTDITGIVKEMEI